MTPATPGFNCTISMEIEIILLGVVIIFLIFPILLTAGVL